jgi:F-type H+-transporting ATPase subunit b
VLLSLSAAAAAPPKEHSAGQGHVSAGHGDSGHDESGHGQSGHGQSGHGDSHGDGHHQEFNWYHGLLGEKEGVEPSLLWRAPGTATPFAATLINTLLLIGLFVRFARKPLAKGLADRRQRIMKGMDDAAAMQKEATEQLRLYRGKLDNLDAEIERVKREMRESAEAERRRVLEEAAARRLRLEQEARVLIERELEALREQLTKETAIAALSSARDLLKRSVSTDDHRRLCEEYITALASTAGSGELPRVSAPAGAPPSGRSDAS